MRLLCFVSSKELKNAFFLTNVVMLLYAVVVYKLNFEKETYASIILLIHGKLVKTGGFYFL